MTTFRALSLGSRDVGVRSGPDRTRRLTRVRPRRRCCVGRREADSTWQKVKVTAAATASRTVTPTTVLVHFIETSKQSRPARLCFSRRTNRAIQLRHRLAQSALCVPEGESHSKSSMSRLVRTRISALRRSGLSPAEVGANLASSRFHLESLQEISFVSSYVVAAEHVHFALEP